MDSQRQKCYNVEHAIDDPKVTEKLATKADVEALVLKVYTRYYPNEGARRGVPKVIFSRANHNGGYWNPQDNTIHLGPTARKVKYVLHEMAHYMSYKIDRKECEANAHGPIFVRVLCELMYWYSGVQYSNTFKKAKVKVASPEVMIKAPTYSNERVDHVWSLFKDLSLPERLTIQHRQKLISDAKRQSLIKKEGN